MRKFFKRFFLLLSLGTFVASLYSVSRHWDYQTTLVDIGKQLHLKVSAVDIEKEINAALEQGEFDNARMYLKLAKQHQFPIDTQRYTHIIETEDTRLARLTKNASKFANGFISGKSSSAAGIAGALGADFTVVGDVRDLHHEYKKLQKGEDVNKLIVALSGVGVGFTALTVGSLGTAAPAKSGISLIKLAAKTRRLSSRFQKQLLKLGKNVFDWKLFSRLVKEARQSKSITQGLKQIPRAARQAYHPKAVEPLKVIATQVNNVRKSTSVADTLHLLKYVETTDDLRHLEKVSLKYGTQTKGIMKLLGKGALRTVRVLRKTAELLWSLIGSVLSAMFSLFFLFAGRRV
jgi:hypothetical protein